MKKIFLLVVMVMICSTFTCRAETVQAKKITLQQAIDLALNDNLAIKAASLNVDIQQNNVKVANRLQNPAITSFYNIGRAADGNANQLGVAQIIEIGKRGARKNLAKSGLELTRENYKFAEFNLKMDVRKSYIDLVAAKSLYNVTLAQKNLLQDLLHIAKRRFEVGKAPELDVLQAEIALNQMVTQLNTARTDVNKAKYNFNKTLNLKDTSTVYDSTEDMLQEKTGFAGLLTPRSKATLPAFDKISEMAANKRFDLKIAKQSIKVAQDNLSLTVRQRIPDLQVQGGYLCQPSSHSGGQGTLPGSFVGVSLVNIPLLYNYSPEIKNAKLQVEQAKMNYDSTKTSALNDLNGSYEDFTTAKTNLNYYTNDMINKSDELIKASKLSYEIGKSNLTTLIVMEQSYQSIKTAYISALEKYYDSWIDFLREVNDEEFSVNAESI